MSIHANRSLRNVSVFFALTLFTASAFGGSTSPEAQKFLKDLRKKLAGVETLTWRFQPNRNSKVEGYFSKKANALKIVERYRGNRSKSVTIFSSDGVSRLDPYSGYIAKGGQSPPYSFATRYWFALPLLHPELLSEHDVTLETTDGDHFLSIEFTSPKATISITFDGKTMGQKGMIIQPGYSSSRMEVIEYHKAGDFLFPKHIKRTTGVGSSGSDIKVESVQFNVELEEDAFSFNEKELLIYDASLKEEDIRQRLKGDLKPIDAASLHFTLGMLAGRTDQNKAEVEYRKSIELYPKASAPRLMVASLIGQRKRDEAEKILVEMLPMFPDSAETIYQRLVYLFRYGNNASETKKLALKWATEWTVKVPDSTNAWTQKAQLHSALKEFEAAGEAYRKSAELAGPSTYQSNNALLGLARVYQNQKDFAKAEEVLKQLLQEKDPQHRWAFPRAFAALAQIYKATEKLDAFLQTKLEEAEQKPDEPSVLLALISIYQAKGDGNKASEYAENLIRLEPSQFPNHQHLVLGNNVPVERRIAILEKLIINEGKLNTTYQYYLTSLFSLYRTANQKEKAEKFAENILSMKQVMPTTLRSIARYFEQSKDFEKAAALYERAAQVARSEREKQGYRAALIRLYQKSGKSDRARKLAEELLDKAEDRHIRVQASRELYQLLAASGDRDAYIKRLEDKVKAAPEDARALQQLSTMMLMGNRHAEAAELFGRLVKLKPDVKDYYPQWAQSLGSAKLHDKAIAAWQRYFKKFPADRQTYMTSLIYAYRAARRLEEVVKHVEEYSKDFPNQTNILGDLARNLQLAGKSDLAIELFESLVQTEKNENNLSYWRQSLLQIYMKRKSYDRAEPLASKLAQTAKQSYQRQQAARSLNTILKATGKLEAWKKELEARVASKPNKADLSLLATSYQSESRHEDAAALHERIVKLESSAENYTQWFQSLNSARKYPELIAAYKTFFKAFPDQRKNHAYSLSNAYRSAGNLEQALVVARELAKSNPSSGLPKVAELLEQMEKHDEAIAAWKEVLKATSNEHQRWQHKSRMVKLLEKQKKVDEALELLRDQIKNAPSEYYIGLARRSYTSLLRKFNMLDAYLKSLEEAVARNPKDAKAIEELAELHQSSRKSAEAAAWYEKLVALRPDKKSYNGWVNALGAINETSAAIRNKKVDALLKAYPAFFKAFPDERKNRLATLVYACRNASREEEAIEFSTQNVSLQPRNAHAHSMHGDTLRHFKKYDRAIASYRKAIELSPKGDKRLWNYKLNIGYALEGQKKFKEAEAVARSLLAETGQSYQKQNVSRFLARVLRAGGGEEKYIAGLEKRINENPKDEEALRQLIAIYPSKGQYKKMPEIYRKLVAVDPTDSNYSNWMYSYGNAADYKGLVDACLEYFKAFPNRKSQHLPRLWDAYRRLGRTQDAIDAAKEYVTLRKGDGNALANAARLYTELKKYEEAESALAEAIKTRKNESSTWNWRYQLAQVCSKRGKHEEAEKLAQELAATATDSYRKRQTGALLTEVFKRSGNISGLIGKLEDQAKANPKDQGILTQLGAIHTANRDYKEAAQVFDKLVTLNPSKNNYYSWTNALSNAGDHLGCAHSLEVFMKKHPDQKVRQISNLVRAYERAKRIDKAIEAARVNVEIDPRDGRSAMQLGDLLRKSSKVDEAVKVYKQTISQTKSKNIRWDLNYRLADTLKDQKKMPEALEVANKLLATARTSSNTSNAKHLLTTILKSSGGLKNYIRTLEKKAAANPKDAQTLAELATLYNDQQQFAQAAATARKLVAISPTASHYQRLIHPLTSLGKHNDLIEVYRELFDKDPKSTRYHLASFIYTCRNVKKTRAAIPLVRQYVKDYPKDFRMLSILADSLRLNGFYRDSITIYKDALKLATAEHYKAQWGHNLALAYKESGQVKEALNELNRAINLSTDENFRKRANDLKVQWLKDAGGTRAYVEDLAEQVRKDPKDAFAIQELIKGYQAQKELKRVAALCEDLVKLRPTRQNYLQWIDVLTQLKLHEKVIAGYQALFEKYPAARADSLSRLMWAYQQAGQEEKAISAGEEYEKLNPKHGFASAQLGYLLLAQKKFVKAIAAYQRAVKLAPSKFHKWDWQFRIAKLYRQSQKVKEAEALLQKLIESAPGPLYEQRAKSLLGTGRQP